MGFQSPHPIKSIGIKAAPSVHPALIPYHIGVTASLRWIRAKKPVVRYHDFVYQAQSWDIPRRVVAKVEWRQGELFPRVGFVVTNLNLPPAGVTHYYNGRGAAEQWIKEGKYALNWTRLSCHRFVANQVRLWLFVLAYEVDPRNETGR